MVVLAIVDVVEGREAKELGVEVQGDCDQVFSKGYSRFNILTCVKYPAGRCVEFSRRLSEGHSGDHINSMSKRTWVIAKRVYHGPGLMVV